MVPLFKNIRPLVFPKKESGVHISVPGTESKQALSGGAIAGIDVGVVLGTSLITAIILFFLYKRKKMAGKDIELVAAIDDDQYRMQNVKIKELLGTGNFGEISPESDFVYFN